MPKGLGRWIYCKYCYKYVPPTLGNINQILCPERDYGLTLDFFTFEELISWINQEKEAN